MKHEVTHHTLWQLVGSEEKWKAGFKVYQAPVGLARTHIRATQLWTTQHLNGLLTPPPSALHPLSVWSVHAETPTSVLGLVRGVTAPWCVLPSFSLPRSLPLHPLIPLLSSPRHHQHSGGAPGVKGSQQPRWGGSLAAIHYHETQRGVKHPADAIALLNVNHFSHPTCCCCVGG